MTTKAVMRRALVEIASEDCTYLDHAGDRGVYDHGCPGEVCTAKHGLGAGCSKMWPKERFAGTIADTSTWPWRERFRFWLLYEARLTKRWLPKLSLWWHYNVRHYPKPPPLERDPVYLALFGRGQEEGGSE